jgi:predicted DNA-binding transcriptional regulator AlpA
MVITVFLIVEVGFTTMNLKNWIKENLLTVTGKINTRKIMKDCQWIKENYPDKLNEILEKSSFLINPSFSECLFVIVNDINKVPGCKECNIPVKFQTFVAGYREFCSPKCVANHKETKDKIKKTIRNNPDYLKMLIDKRKKTNMERYGCEHVFQSDMVKDKIKQTVQEKYGVDNVSQSDQVKESVKKTIQEKYGVDNISNVPEIRDKAKQTNIERYGTTIYSQSEQHKENIKKFFIEKYGTKTFKESMIMNYNDYNRDFIQSEMIKDGYINVKEMMEYFNLSRSTVYKFLRENNIEYKTPISVSSSFENEISEFLISHGINIERNTRDIISPKEIDIYIPQHRLGIEFNGLYWHSEANGCDKNYHLNKTLECEKRGIQLIHIFEDEWIFKEPIVKSILLSKMNKFDRVLYGRNCRVIEISHKESNEFLEKNHLSGGVNSSVQLALVNHNDIMAVMTFGRRQITSGKSSFELLRFCTRLNHQVVGGASKLFTYFLRTNDSCEIKTYADRRFSNGNFYKNVLGFEQIGISSPNYFYFKGLERFNRMKFQKHKLKDFLESFNEAISERDNLINNDYNRVFDCGSFVYIYNKEK